MDQYLSDNDKFILKVATEKFPELIESFQNGKNECENNINEIYQKKLENSVKNFFILSVKNSYIDICEFAFFEKLNNLNDSELENFYIKMDEIGKLELFDKILNKIYQNYVSR